MDALRREVVSPIPAWRRPHALATLCLATLLFMSSLDAMLIAYRMRCEAAWAAQIQVELNRARARAELEQLIAEQDALFAAVRAAELAVRQRAAADPATASRSFATKTVVVDGADPLLDIECL